MSTENKPTNQKLLAKLQQAQRLLDECIAGLQGQPHKSTRTLVPAPRPKGVTAHRDLDFEVHERAFIKAHARELSGSKKFVLLLAYLAKGQAGKEVQLKDIENHWNKMTAPNLLDGNFNRFYTNSAKENGWVNTKKQGVYILRPQWRDILANE
jgi:CHASE2 domain-containing sensor protein